MNMLVESQEKLKMVVYPELVGLGRRKPELVFGTRLKEFMQKKGMSEEELVNYMGNSYKATVERVLNNAEVPKKIVIDKILKLFDAKLADFTDTELENVVCVQNGIIVGEFKTNERALEVCKEMQKKLVESHVSGEKIVYQVPEA